MQLRQLFGFCGSVTDVRFSGDPERFAIIEYGAPGVRFLLLVQAALCKS